MFFISVEFRGLSDPVSSLSATLTGDFISVESKGLTEAVCLSEINWAGREDIEWVGRTAWRARMVRRAPSFARGAAGRRRKCSDLMNLL